MVDQLRRFRSAGRRAADGDDESCRVQNRDQQLHAVVYELLYAPTLNLLTVSTSLLFSLINSLSSLLRTSTWGSSTTAATLILCWVDCDFLRSLWVSLSMISCLLSSSLILLFRLRYSSSTLPNPTLVMLVTWVLRVPISWEYLLDSLWSLWASLWFLLISASI